MENKQIDIKEKNKKKGLIICDNFMVSLPSISTVSLEDSDYLMINIGNQLYIEIVVSDIEKAQKGDLDSYLVPVNEFHRIKRELEEYFDVTFN